MPDGVKFMHGGRLATLFSARNYLDGVQNDSALLLIAADTQGCLRVRAKKLLQRTCYALGPHPGAACC